MLYVDIPALSDLRKLNDVRTDACATAAGDCVEPLRKTAGRSEPAVNSRIYQL